MITTVNHSDLKLGQTCFAVSRHNSIIPLVISNIEDLDLDDEFYSISFDINTTEPTAYMRAQHKADFMEKTVSEFSPIFDKYSKIRLTLSEAKELAKNNLNLERETLIKQLKEIDQKILALD